MEHQTSISQMEVADRVFHTSLVKGLLALRFTIEFASKSRGVHTYEDVCIVEHVKHLMSRSKEIRKVATTEELKLLDAPIGEWPSDVMVYMSWQSEACGCLLWSLGELDEFPPFDQPFGLYALDKYFEGLQGLKWVIPFSQRHVMFRNEEEIRRVRQQAERVLQRCFFAEKIRSGLKNIPRKSYDELFHFSEVNLPVGPSGDLVLFGHEFCDFSELEEKTVLPVSLSRTQAFYWIQNSEQPWNDVHLEGLYDTLPE